MSPPAMSRRSLRPQLNQIRGWVRQGRTDAWIAHQLEVTVQQIQSFKRENELEADGDSRRRADRGGRPPRRGRRRHRRRARGRGGPPRRGGGQARRGGRQARRRGGRRARRGRRRRRSPRPASAPAAATRTRRRDDATGAVRGHVRPRRGGLRAVARPRRRGQPDLRRALGGPPARRGHDRGGPDRHPPRQWRRRRRLSSRACGRTAGRCSSAAPAGPSRSRTARRSSPPRIPTKWDLNLLVVEDASRTSAEELIAEAERLQAPAGLRHRKIEVHSGGDALVDGFEAAGWSAERVVVMLLRPGADQRGEAPAQVREVEFPAVRGLMEQWYGEAMSAAEARDLADADADTALHERRALLPGRARRRAGRVLHAARGRRRRPGRGGLHRQAAPRPRAWPAPSSAPRSPRRRSAATT